MIAPTTPASGVRLSSLKAQAKLIAGLLLLLITASPSSAEGLVVSLSKPRITITSSFSGESIVLFGVADPEDTENPSAPFDVVVTVRGPNESFTTWRKERRLGLWTNTDSRTFLAAPSYLAVLSNRPPMQIASADILRQEQAGFAFNRLLQRVGSDYADVVQEDPFRRAFLRVKQTQGLYVERPSGVTFIAPRVFRAEFPIPGTAPIGEYEVVVKMFRDGEALRRAGLSLRVAKVDFEQAVASAAQDHPLLYGLVTALGALVVGFLGNLAFRRE